MEIVAKRGEEGKKVQDLLVLPKVHVGTYITNQKLMPIGVARGGGDRGMFKSLQFVGGVGVCSLCVQVSILGEKFANASHHSQVTRW